MLQFDLSYLSLHRSRYLSRSCPRYQYQSRRVANPLAETILKLFSVSHVHYNEKDYASFSRILITILLCCTIFYSLILINISYFIVNTHKAFSRRNIFIINSYTVQQFLFSFSTLISVSVFLFSESTEYYILNCMREIPYFLYQFHF